MRKYSWIFKDNDNNDLGMGGCLQRGAKYATDELSTHFLITWHNLHNTNEEHAEDSVAS